MGKIIVLTFVLTACIIWILGKGVENLKQRKSYRFSWHTMQSLDFIKEIEPGRTETEIIERAVNDYANKVMLREGARNSQNANIRDEAAKHRIT